MDDVFTHFANLYDEDKHDDLLQLSNKTLHRTTNPYTRHLAFSFKALAQMELGKARYAFTNAKKALIDYPGCPWALWVQAFVSENLARLTGQPEDIAAAIKACDHIIKMRLTALRKDKCMLDVPDKEINSFVVDSWFFLGFLYELKGEKVKAIKALENFLRLVEQGEYTSFDPDEAVSELERIQSE